jgi:hypothetical protein
VLHRRIRPGHGGGAGGGRAGAQPARDARAADRAEAAALGLDSAGLATVKARTGGGQCVPGLCFPADRGSPAERFATLRRELGDGFEAIAIGSSPGNPHGIPKNAHSVLTLELVDTHGHPATAALDQVMAFFAERLRA